MENITGHKDSTEQKILDASHLVFLKKGLDGTRMQEIADTAGINKALLHYYFRSKQKLFEAIFRNIISEAFPNIRGLIFSDIPFEKKVEGFVEKYIDMLVKNPYLPAFILKEINRDPEFMANTLKNLGINPAEILLVFEKEMENGRMRKMDSRHLITNLLSLIIFPFAASPILNILLFDGNKKMYREFLVSRKKSVSEFILNAIMIP